MNKAESKYFNTAVKLDRALLSLLEKKSFAYITVSEICKEAGVNRSTFYLHYETLGDLLEETARYVIDDFSSCFSAELKKIFLDIDGCELKELNFITNKYLQPYLGFIREKRRVFSTFLAHPSTFNFSAFFNRLFDNVFDPILDRFDYPPEERKYVMMFYLNGITAIVTQWVKDGCEKSTEEVSCIIQHCIFGKGEWMQLGIV
ncbi:MAG: TetR/AcrR family transcriptional regulator [Christensenellaceae bacterium]|nr:TetR/AcrR family transcriptional regulator [Christensenellaceae bacterium]